MSEEHADTLKKVREVFVAARRTQINEAVRLIAAGNPAGAMHDAQRAIALQGEIEMLDRAIADELDEGYLPKGAA